MKRIIGSILILLSLFPIKGGAQQDQQTTAISQRNNVKYVNGVGVGYRPQISSGLTLAVSSGTAFCSGSIVTYAGGTLSMTASSTNYIYLNTSSSCAPATKTSTFSASDIPIAVVVTGLSTITSITDDRTIFFSGSSSASTITGSGLTAGDVYYVSAAGTLTAAKADASTTLPAICLATSTTVCQLSGVYTTSGLTATAIYYVSDATAGAILSTAPTTSGHYLQRIGVAFSTTQLLLNFSPDVAGIQ